MSDLELLRGYVRDGSEEAFAQLAERHVDLVYSAAQRLVRDTHLAEDVTQQVFTLLARKAGQLGDDTILSAWLYRTARHVASDTLRRESRRLHREQLAVESMNPSSPDLTWQQIEPELDEAMGKLCDADHDALVLRYFENRSLKEVGAALGSSEDAAQKRVTRALERLRASLMRRGVTVSMTALAAAVTSGAVQSAPAGLAASAASVSVASTANTSIIPNFFHVMTTANSKLVVALAVAATLTVSMVLLLDQNASLRREVASMQASATEAARMSAATGAAEAERANEELQQLRKEHSELLRLRGRVTQLANELRQRNAAGAQTNTSPTPDGKEADSPVFTAALTNRVPAGQTLVAGGWAKGGLRGYLLSTPAIEAGDGTPAGRLVRIQSQIVWAPESFWEQLGWGASKSETRLSTLVGVITPGQLDSLIQNLKATRDAELSNTSQTRCGDGEYFSVALGMDDDNENGVAVVMNVSGYPKIAPDGQSVDLALHPAQADPKVPVHSSIRQATGP